MESKEEVLDVLKKSLGMEEDGYKLYSEGSKKITNSLGKRMMERLAQDELNHFKRIKEIWTYVTGESTEEAQISKPEITDFNELFNRLKEQFKDAIDDLTEVGVDDQEIIDMGLQLESHSHFFYKESAQKAKDPKVKKFYEMLAKEEKSHHDALQNTNKYLENPALFFGMGYH
jgi:rubrerythrin